ncbi:MAG: MFS transporter [Candidatus Hermodarchaeota archaeon]
MSDRTKTRYGRRRPYILYMVVPATIVWILVWFPIINDPTLSNGLLFFLYFTIMISGWDSLYTLVDINQQALFPEMFSPEERPGVNSWRFVFAGLGLLSGVALPPIIAEMISSNESYGYGAVGVFFGALSLLTYLFTFLGSKENLESQLEEPLNFKEGINRLMNRSFATFVGYNLSMNYIAVLGPGIIPFFIEYVIIDYNLPILGELSFATASSIILGIIFIIGIASVPFWSILIKKLGERRTTFLIAIVYGSAFLPWLIVNTLSEAFIFAILLGPGVGGALVIPDILISQVIDEDEVKTGRRREGMHYGFNNLVIRTSFVFYSLTASIVFLLTRYDATLTQQLPSAVLGIRLLESVFPALAACFSLICLYFYPLHGEKWKEIKDKTSLINKGGEFG